ncbi:MAG: hypothetical protein WC307_07140 [Candidatus Nanoarchaeia archaeon]
MKKEITGECDVGELGDFIKNTLKQIDEVFDELDWKLVVSGQKVSFNTKRVLPKTI